MAPIGQFNALADATRCRVLELLQERARPVHELAGEFAISRPAISRHLRVLKDAGLVRELRRGRENVYAIEAGELARVDRWLARFRTARPVSLRSAVALAAGPDLFGWQPEAAGLN